jgi:hypothetical protein
MEQEGDMLDLRRPIAFGGNPDPIAADPTWPLTMARLIAREGAHG